MAVRNLKYGLPNNQITVEQPVYKGTPLTKWIHNGIVVWENGGAKSVGFIAKYSSGRIVLDLSDKNHITCARITGTTHINCNEKVAIRMAQQRSDLNVSKDLVNWVTLKTTKPVMAWIPTHWGVLYVVHQATNEVRHLNIDFDKLEVISDVELMNDADTQKWATNGTGADQWDGWCRLDGFYYGFSKSGSETLSDKTVYFNEYDVKDNEVVGLIKNRLGIFQPYLSYQNSSQLKNCVVLDRRVFAYGGVNYRQVIQISKESGSSYTNVTEESATNVYTFGQWLNEKAYREGQTEKEFQERRASIKNTVMSNYPEILSEKGEQTVFGSPYSINLSGGVGDELEGKYGANYYRVSSSAVHNSGFLGDAVPSKNVEFDVFRYNSTSKKWEISGKKLNVYASSEYSITSDDNYAVKQGHARADSAILLDNGKVSYEDSPYYVMYFSTYYIAFRHKTDSKKNFAIYCGSGTTTPAPIDIPSDYFD